MKKKIIIIILVALAAGGAYFLKMRPAEKAAAANPVLYGNVDIREVALGFRVAGRLEKMNLEEGDQVRKGDVLAELDRQPLAEELTIRQAQVKEIEASLDNAEKTYDRRASLVRKGSVSVSDFDDAASLRDELTARLETAQAQLALAETSLNDAALLAPSDGTVLTRVREPGSILPVGTVVYTVSLDRPVWIRAYVDEPDLALAYPGRKVRVKTDSGGSYEGQIGFVSPRAEFTPKTVETTRLRTDLVYRLRITVENPDQGLRQGMPVTVEF